MLLVVLTLLSAPPSDAPLREPERPDLSEVEGPQRWQNYAVPALENLAVSFGLLAFRHAQHNRD